MFNNEIRRMLIKQALLSAVPVKFAYTPPLGGDPNAMGGMPPGMDPSMMGGMPPGMDPSMMGGTPPGADPNMMGGMPPGGAPGAMVGMPSGGDPGAMGGMPLGGDSSAASGMPPTDMSGVDPSVDTAPGGGEAKAQLQSALAVLREGIKQMEKAVEAMSGSDSSGAPKEASFRGYGYYNVDPVQRLVLFLNSLDY